MEYLKKLNQIVEGYSKLLLSTDDKELTHSRAEICASCEINDDNICSHNRGGCGCYIPAKVRCKDCECPFNKW